MAKARPVPGIGEDDAFARVAARVVAIRAAELHEHSANVLDLGEIEYLHAMRVATRRLRATLEIFEACFPRKRFKAVLKEVKGLTDELGERRDRDVGLVRLDEFAAELGPSDRPGIRSFAAALRDEQAEINRTLAPIVAPSRMDALQARLRELVAAADPEPPVSSNGSSPHDLDDLEEPR